jgi:hypothetical protein
MATAGCGVPHNAQGEGSVRGGIRPTYTLTPRRARGWVAYAQTGNDTLLAERVAAHPERLENLYFAYLFVLRATVKLSAYLPAYDLSTGNATEDAHVEVGSAVLHTHAHTMAAAHT